MIPRPVFKLLVLGLWLPVFLGSLGLWFMWGAPPRPYYLGTGSWFQYERLSLPPMPRLPWGDAVAEKYTILGYSCGAQEKVICLATPETYRAHKTIYYAEVAAPASVVREQLARQVFGGSAVGCLWGPLTLGLGWLVLGVPLATWADWRRRRRLMAGVQLSGRWPVSPARFGGVWSWRKRRYFHVDVESPSHDETTPPLA